MSIWVLDTSSLMDPKAMESLTEEYRKDQAGMPRGVGTCMDLDVEIRNWNFTMPC